jgi:hypothetical protein
VFRDFSRYAQFDPVGRPSGAQEARSQSSMPRAKLIILVQAPDLMDRFGKLPKNAVLFAIDGAPD